MGVQHTPAHRADIDGLRAVAVLLVLVFHFRLWPGTGEGGFLGVDVFFVISGYLITRILVADLTQGRFSFADFYLRRVRRLAPALQATLLLVIAVAWPLLLPLEMAELSREVVAAQSYLANVYFWKRVSYFGLAADGTPLLHTWSLAVEEQFYLLFPLGLWLVHRAWGDRARWLLTFGLVLAVSLALNLGLSPLRPGTAFYLLPTRAWQLLAGACLAVAPAARPGRRGWREALALGGLGSIGYAVLAHHPALPTPGAWAMLPVLGALAVLRAGDAGPTAAGRLLGWGPVAYIGRISYPAYLVHWPIHVLAIGQLGERYSGDAAARCGLLLLSLALAALIHHAVEQPVQRSAWARRPRPLLAVYLGCLAASLALLVASQRTEGLPERFSPEVARLADGVLDHPPPLTECSPEPGLPITAAAPCLIGRAGSAPQWLVYGDSHAWAAYPALQAWLDERGEAAVFTFRQGCPPLLDVYLPQDGDNCPQFNREALTLLGAQPALHQVLLVSTWMQATEGRLQQDTLTATTRQASVERFGRQFAATLHQLKGLGREVWIWAPVPGARGNPPMSLARAALRGAVPDALAWSAADYRERTAFFFDAVAREQASIDRLVRPADTLCNLVDCPVSRDGRPLYIDPSHTSGAATPLLVEGLRRAAPPPFSLSPAVVPKALPTAFPKTPS